MLSGHHRTLLPRVRRGLSCGYTVSTGQVGDDKRRHQAWNFNRGSHERICRAYYQYNEWRKKLQAAIVSFQAKIGYNCGVAWQ